MSLFGSFGDTAMRICGVGRAEISDVFARSLAPRTSAGKRMVCFPKLRTPMSATTSIVLSAMPTGKFAMILRYLGGDPNSWLTGAADNGDKDAANSPLRELPQRKGPLAMTHVCAPQVLNTAAIGGYVSSRTDPFDVLIMYMNQDASRGRAATSHRPYVIPFKLIQL